jgi:para-aminobenzoate synthetase / 4-amino-4-deoxychorismate lyase
MDISFEMVKMGHLMTRVVLFEETNTGTPAGYELLDLVEIVEARSAEEVLSSLTQVERAVEEGLYAGGFIAYEAAAGLDPVFKVHSGTALPLVWFGLFRRKEPMAAFHHNPGSFSVGSWGASVTQEEYRERVSRIKEYIACGDTYQVNYTFRMRAGFEGDPWGFFLNLFEAQPSSQGAFIETEEWAICSASPEVFFQLDGNQLFSRPMKGTAARGLSFADDRLRMQALRISAKDRAENTMIVDMIRNDMGRIAEVGSVSVSSLFQVERYPTVFQMTSTVGARTNASFTEIIKAMFPCASITGAPKIRTMEIIRALESEGRGVYTGCIGSLEPGRRAKFNVAIRTAVIDRKKHEACYGLGGGIVWDSTQKDEYTECQTKALIITSARPEFELLETLLWESEKGYFLLDRHLWRLSESAEYFGFILDLKAIRDRLAAEGERLGGQRSRVRLCVSRQGAIRIEPFPMPQRPSDSLWRVGLADRPVDRKNPFLFHKTTNRRVFQDARTESAEVDDVLLWNEFEQVTETRIGNIVIEKEGRLITPPVSCGLLPGVFRGELLSQGEIREGVVTLQDLRQAGKWFVINSVRRWMKAQLI